MVIYTASIHEEPEIVAPDLYNRQEELDLNTPEKVCVIGIGGIGSWVAVNMGLAGVKELVVVDYDLVELHNLNRTPFEMLDVSLQKTMAIAQFLTQRRPELQIKTITRDFAELRDFELHDLQDALIIDCRDNLDPLPIKNNKVIKLGYDGVSGTIILNPKYEKVWDLEPEEAYSTVPSFLAPCQFLANAVLTLVTDPEFNVEDYSNKIVTLDIQEHFKELLK